MPDFARGLKPETPEQIAQRFPFQPTHYDAPRAEATPTSVDLRGGATPTPQRPVADPHCQDGGGACVLFSQTASRAALRIRAGAPFVRYSPAFNWWLARQLEGTQNENGGVAVSDGWKSFMQHGACPEPLDPYVWQDFAVGPTQPQLDVARPFKVASWHNIQGAEEAKQALASGTPVIITVRAYEDFEHCGEDGIMPAGAFGETRDPNHENLVAGYDGYWCYGLNWWDDRYRGAQSLGYRWGQRGYYYFPVSEWDRFVYDASVASLKAIP